MKVFQFILIGLIGLWGWSCSDNSIEPDLDRNPEPEPEETVNTVYETYFLHGLEIELFPKCAPCTGHVDTTYDTTKVAFTTTVKLMEDNPDTVQFFGLEGANAGRYSAYEMDCREIPHLMPENCINANYENNEFNIDVNHTGFVYKANGTFQNDQLDLDGFYEYRGDSLGYQLTGTKVDEMSSDSRYPGGNEREVVTGIYFVSGEKIIRSYSDWPIPEGEDEEIETIELNFTLNVKLMEDKTVRFVGLPGADAGVFDDRLYPECINPEECKIYGEKSGEDEYQINMENGERSYQANLFLKNYLELEGTYQYQNNTIDYELEGQRYVE